ncbi:MAG TPA: polyphosphate kinase 2 family protein [Haloferula sp.]
MKYDLDSNRKISIDVGDKGCVEFKLRDILVPPDSKISLKKDYDPDFTGGFDDKAGALERVAANVQRLSELQEKLYAQDVYGILIIFQAIDAAGKDGAIRHVMSGVNPQGCHVTSFKSPSSEELDHDYLWRATKALPARGMIGIFNRSYYEEVLAVKIHPEFLSKQNLPGKPGGKGFWERRYKEINRFEKYLTSNGIIPIKFFLNLSKKEQKKRFLARIDEPKKNWKFSVADFKERALWDDYQQAFEDMLNNTSSEHAPWFVIPSDNKWFARLAISEAICTVLERLKLKFPDIGDERRAELLKIREELVND